MTVITTRAGKGAPLTNAEVDANFTGLNEALDQKANAESPTTTGELTHSGDIILSGSGKRITGDFSNAVLANRMMFQTSKVNGSTVLGAMPNGAGAASAVWTFNTSDPANSSVGYLLTTATETTLGSTKYGTGSYLPITIHTGGVERMSLDINGRLLKGAVRGTVYDTYAPNAQINAYHATGGGAPATAGTSDANISYRFSMGNISLDIGGYAAGGVWIQNRLCNNFGTNYDIYLNPNGGAVIVGKNAKGMVTANAASLSFDMSASNFFTCTPATGGTLTFTNIAAGQSGNILFTNNGNYAIAKSAAVKAGSSFLSTISATGVYWISYYSPDGANVYLTTSGAMS